MLSNLGNTQAGIEEGIRTTERIHWTLGLKQAENTILEKRRALSSNFLSIQKVRRDIELKKERVSWLNPIVAIARFIPLPLIRTALKNHRDNLADEIDAWEKGMADTDPLIRDCLFELEVSERERARILEEHPEALTMTYQELQEQSITALREKKLHYLTPRYWAARNSLPETVAVTLFEAGEEERDYLLARIVQEISAQPIPDEVLDTSLQISRLPWTEKQFILGLLNGSQSSRLPG